MRNRFLSLLCLLAAGGCSSELTEVIVTVDVSAGIPCDIDAIEIRAENSGVVETVSGVVMAAGLPASASIVTDGSDVVDVEVVGIRAGVEVLQAMSRVSTIKGESIHLAITLANECTLGSPCVVDGSALPAFTSVPGPVGPRECTACVPADPAVEACNGVDDDCDGNVDEGACVAPIERYTYEDVSGFESFVDACTVPGASRGVILESANEQESLTPELVRMELGDMGFDFSFYGAPIEAVWVGDNGYVAFTPDAPNSIGTIEPGPLDTAGVPRSAVFPFWEKLETRPTGVCVTLSDAAARRRLLITWTNVCFTPCGASDRLTFTVALEEDSNRVLFLYGNMEAGDPARARGNAATVGITGPQSPADRACTPTQCGQDGLCMTGDNMGQPCGFTQVFSRAAQPGSLPLLEFTPVASDL